MGEWDPDREVWPVSLEAARFKQMQAVETYLPLVQRLHTLELLGLSDAITVEMKRRNSSPKMTAARVARRAQRDRMEIGNR